MQTDIFVQSYATKLCGKTTDPSSRFHCALKDKEFEVLMHATVVGQFERMMSDVPGITKREAMGCIQKAHRRKKRTALYARLRT